MDQQQQQTAGAAAGGDAAAPNMVNPHNPEFITKKPWYLGDSNEPTLDHQTAPTLNKKTPLSLSASEALVAKHRQVSEKFQKGQWVEALKKNKLPYRICQILQVNARQTEFDVKYEDGTIEKRIKVFGRGRPRIRRTQRGTRTTAAEGESYDSKRDAYHGYDNETHNQRLTARFEEREAIRKKFREGLKKDDEDDEQAAAGSEEDDEYVQRDEDDKVITTRLARQGGVGGAQMKVTARNLRIREDTAKYLRNLDPNSAYYDPKSRSMRDNPNPEMPPEESTFAGDNFARVSGDAVQLADTQLFAWDAADKGVQEVHPQANPSQVEMLKKQYRSKATDLKLEQKKAVLDKYGGEEYLDGSGGLAEAATDKSSKHQASTNRNIRFGANTKEERYNPDGRVVGSNNTAKREAIPCKYEEDVFINGHTTVWGSYFHKGAFQWGYADDHSLIKMSYCTGATGRLANDEANELQYGTGKAGSAALAQARKMLQAKAPPGNRTAGNGQTTVNRSKLYGEASDQHQVMDEAKVQAALERAKKRDQGDTDDRKRKYHSMNAEADLTEEDMEAYRLNKNLSSDPMAKLEDDEVLEYKK